MDQLPAVELREPQGLDGLEVHPEAHSSEAGEPRPVTPDQLRKQFDGSNNPLGSPWLPGSAVSDDAISSAGFGDSSPEAPPTPDTPQTPSTSGAYDSEQQDALGSESAVSSATPNRIRSESSSKNKKLRKRRTSSKGPKELKDINPTSTPSVFSNLIIAEDSLRKQYIELQTFRRRNLLFFVCLVTAASSLTYVNFVMPSKYQWIYLIERLTMITAYISLGLFFLTGLYTKVFLVTPKFITDANKGMRAYNVRLVRTSSTLKEKLMHIFNPVYTERPGGLVKLVPSARVFSPHFIEAWEVYRLDFWEREARNPSKSTTMVSSRSQKKRPRGQSGSSSTGATSGLLSPQSKHRSSST